MDALAVIASSALVAALVGAGTGYLSQRSLADRQVRLNYEYNARKRLYEVVGPLRFQLLMAARDVLRRVPMHLDRDWVLDPLQYYAHSFIYRLLRPLAIGILIQRQMSYADFAVDTDSVDLLRFEAAVYRMFNTPDPLHYYSGLDWKSETQTVFRDNLRAAATRLLTTDRDGTVIVIDYSTFCELCPDPLADKAIAPLAWLFARANRSLVENPVLWTRIVGYAYVCQWILEHQDKYVGVSLRNLDVPSLLKATGDPQIITHVQDYPGIFDRVLGKGT